ncbi:MAG TPA: Hsp20/alpha crystallin family protein [Phycisphaerales bacterium]|nr:Hsp20/alpha crystallin family protein [Phycisphaerales bacterium]
MSCNEKAMVTTPRNTVPVAFVPAASRESAWQYRPDVDIWERSDSYLIEMDVPGATPDRIDLTVAEHVLTVRADVPPRFEQGFSPVRVEYGVGDYFRQFELPRTADMAGIHATCSEGVLRITLPKVEAAKPRVIPISGE